MSIRKWHVALWVLVLLAGMARAQDTPVTIEAGSPLEIKLPATAPDWVIVNANQVGHPAAGKTVRRVQVQYADGTQSEVTFSGQQCEIDLTYGKISVVATTNPQGKALRIRTGPGTFAQDYNHPSGKAFVSKVTDAAVTALAVKKAGQAQPGIVVKPGHTVIRISYE